VGTYRPWFSQDKSLSAKLFQMRALASVLQMGVDFLRRAKGTDDFVAAPVLDLRHKSPVPFVNCIVGH
jgi:hypothetical protein